MRQPERIFDFEAKGQDFNVFVFEPLGPHLLEYTNQPSKRPFGSRNARLTAVYLLHAMDFLHANGIAHTGEPDRQVQVLRLAIDNVQLDIKLDNIQITLPDEQDSYLDTFCATEKSSPSLSKLGKGDAPVVASREMKQVSSATRSFAILARRSSTRSDILRSFKRCPIVPLKSFSALHGTTRLMFGTLASW